MIQAPMIQVQMLVRQHGNVSETIAGNVEVADTLMSRTKGLLGREHLDDGAALWILHCNSIHTWFMRFAIDALFVDENLKVVSIHQDLKPWRVTIPHFRARSVFEFPAGALRKVEGLKAGDQLSLTTGGAHG